MRFVVVVGGGDGVLLSLICISTSELKAALVSTQGLLVPSEAN